MKIGLSNIRTGPSRWFVGQTDFQFKASKMLSMNRTRFKRILTVFLTDFFRRQSIWLIILFNATVITFFLERRVP